MRKWLPLLIRASAQFVMVLDSSVMNWRYGDAQLEAMRLSFGAVALAALLPRSQSQSRSGGESACPMKREGGNRHFMRPITDDVYGIQPERVIGSSTALRDLRGRV